MRNKYNKSIVVDRNDFEVLTNHAEYGKKIKNNILGYIDMLQTYPQKLAKADIIFILKNLIK